MMKYLLPVVLLGSLAVACPSKAQTPSLATVVSACGTPPSTYTAGQQRPILQDTTGTQCTAGSSSGSATTVTPKALTPTDRSISLTTGGTAQNIMASNASRKGCTIQNPSTAANQGIASAESIYVSFTGTAAAASTSFELTPGMSITCSPLGIGVYQTAVSVVAATTGHKIVAVEGQ